MDRPEALYFLLGLVVGVAPLAALVAGRLID